MGLKNCLKRGVGVSICPTVLVVEELRAGNLIRLPWDQEPVETSVLMIWHVEKWCSPLLKEFMAVSEEILIRSAQ